MYPLVRPGSFVLIDETLRYVQAGHWRTEYDRPIYFIELRTGYACGWCEINGNELTLTPHPLSGRPHRRFPLMEAEVIGQVTAVVMHLLDSNGSFSKPAPQLPKQS